MPEEALHLASPNNPNNLPFRSFLLRISVTRAPLPVQPESSSISKRLREYLPAFQRPPIRLAATLALLLFRDCQVGTKAGEEASKVAIRYPDAHLGRFFCQPWSRSSRTRPRGRRRRWSWTPTTSYVGRDPTIALAVQSQPQRRDDLQSTLHTRVSGMYVCTK